MSISRSSGLIALCLFGACRIAMGIDPSASTTTTSPLSTSSPAPTSAFPMGTAARGDISNSAATPSMMALPAPSGSTTSSNGPAIDASSARKFYTFSVALRETYDDNVNTANVHKVSSFESNISPSVLVDFPRENNDFSAAYTFGLTYYSNTGGTGSNVQYSHNFSAQLRHDFSTRFSLNASDALVDSTEPNLFGTTGTPYRDGENISNAFSTGFSAQWTPIVGSQTTYANTVVKYMDQAIANGQDSLENTASHTFSVSVLPKISATFGAIYDNITYDVVNRGYSSYTGFVGGVWQVLPNVNFSVRGGATYTETEQTAFLSGAQSSASQIAPYADLSGSWQIGQRSTLSGDYSHEVTPTDQVGANGQQADRISGTFTYEVTPQLNTHLQLLYTYSTISGGLINDSALQSYNENEYAVDVGASYNFIKYLSLTLDITESGVSSQLSNLNYTRDQATIGVRGTY